MKIAENSKIFQIAQTIAAQGAEFRGLQNTPRGALVMFTDAVTRTTLALLESEFCAETVSLRLQQSRDLFASGN